MTPTLPPLTDAEACDLVRKHSWFATNASDGYVLVHWPDYVAAARAAYTLALSRTVDREREAAKRALDALADATPSDGAYRSAEDIEDFRDRYLAATYPTPTRELRLSDGSVVTYKDGALHSTHGQSPRVGATVHSWMCLLRPEHTGADFDALKAYAAEVSRG